MINDILNALSLKLKEKLDCTVYIDYVPQKLKLPCVFITTISNEERIIIYPRYKATTVFDIAYNVDANNIENMRNIYDVIEKINNITDFLTLENGDILRGKDRENSIVDKVAHCNVTFDYFIYKETEKEEYMENLTMSGGIKNGEES